MKKTIGKLVMALLLSTPLTLSAANLTWDGDGDGTWSGNNWWNGSANVLFTNGLTKTGTSANGSPTLTMTDVTGLAVGQTVFLANVAVGYQTITAITGTQLTLSANASGAASAGGSVFTFGTDDVTFNGRGAVGAITVVGSQIASNMTISTPGYIFNGGTITVNGRMTVSADATINSQIRTNGINFTTANTTLTLGGGSPALTRSAQSIIGETAARSTATLKLTNGEYKVEGSQFNSNIGNFTTGSFGLVLAAGATLTVGVSNQIGTSGEGVLRIEGGWWNQNGADTVIGRSVNNKGYVILSSGSITHGATQTRDLLVGFQAGIGKLDVKDGVVDIRSGAIALNSANTNTAGAYGELNISGGTVNAGRIFLNQGINYGASTTGSAILKVSGGLVNLGTNGIQNGGGGTSTYAITLSGGTLGALASAGWSSALNMTLSGANGGVKFNTTGGGIKLSGILSGSGTFSKIGAGTLLLSGANTYSGDAIISAGTLEVGAGGSLTLGELTFALDGASVGSVTGAGALTLNKIAFDMTNAGSGGAWDVSGIFGSLTPTWSGGGLSVSGFSDLGGGLWGNASYEYNSLTGIITTIPEPSALALMVTGGALLLFLRRKR